MKTWMKHGSFVALTALVLGGTASMDRLSAIPSAALLVASSVLLACATSGRFHWASVSFGAVGAFLGAALRTTSFAAAGAVVLACVFAERTFRVRGGVGRSVHAALALLAGGGAMALAGAFGTRDVSLFGVAVVVGTALCALPLLIDADDSIASELDRISKLVPSAVANDLRAAAHMRRHGKDVTMDADVEKNVEGTFETLLRLAEARVRIARATEVDIESGKKVAGLVDGKISLCVTALRKAFAASDTVSAYATARDDQELHALSAKSESIEEASRTLLEAEADVAALSIPAREETPAAPATIGIPSRTEAERDLAHTA